MKFSIKFIVNFSDCRKNVRALSVTIRSKQAKNVELAP